jgi:hypothetical protein
MSMTPNNENNIVNERLRQARWSFDLALICIVLCVSTSVSGLWLLYKGKITEGFAASASGVIPISKCVKFAREANDRLDRLKNEDEDENNPNK